MHKDFSDSLVSEPPGPALQACVVVPARNEEELLPSALRSLAEQRTADGKLLPHEIYEVILLINNTTDRSAQIATSFRRLYPTFRLHVIERVFARSHAHIGHVRRLLMDEACRRLEAVVGTRPAILSTDADSQVAPNWISANLNELANGAEAVGGRIVVLPCEQDLLDPATRTLHRYDHVYRRLVSWTEHRFDPEPHDPWPRHHHHYGASLAVTPETYKAAGRLPPRRFFEDLAFHDALVQRDVRLRHSNRVKVFTSARLSGRARFGLSRQLSEWEKCGKKALRLPVENGNFLEYLFAARRRLRLLWLDYRDTGELAESRVKECAKRVGIAPRELLLRIQRARYFGGLLEEVKFYGTCRKTWPDWMRLAPLQYAADELQAQFKALSRSGEMRFEEIEPVEIGTRA